MEYAKPDPANPTAPWIVHSISEKSGVNAHGMGVGDINGDGRMDVVTPAGWWEQPPKGSTQETVDISCRILRQRRRRDGRLRRERRRLERRGNGS